MDFNELYQFLFETYYGIGVLVAAGLVLSILISAVLEWRTRRMFVNHEVSEDDDESVWSFFDDDEEDEEEESDPAGKSKPTEKPTDKSAD